MLRRAVEVDATVARFGSEFAVLDRAFAVGGQRLTLQGLGGVYEDIFLPLAGEHQATNAALALAAVEAFFGAGASRQLDIAAVQDGFAAVASPGRLERVRTSPTIMVDAAHNPHGAAALAAALAAEFSFTRLVGVLAVMADKDVRGILEALADSFDEIVVTRNSSARSMSGSDLAETRGRRRRRGEGARGGADGRGDRAGRRSRRGRSRVRAGQRRDHHRVGRVRRRRPGAGRIGAGMSADVVDPGPESESSRSSGLSGESQAPRRRPPRTPNAGLRGVMSATLVLEAITVLLAIPVAANTGDLEWARPGSR